MFVSRNVIHEMQCLTQESAVLVAFVDRVATSLCKQKKRDEMHHKLNTINSYSFPMADC